MQVDPARTQHEDAIRRLSEVRIACKELLHQFHVDNREDPEVHV